MMHVLERELCFCESGKGVPDRHRLMIICERFGV